MNTEQNDIRSRAAWHGALADTARIDIVDRLTYTDLSPSELQNALDLPSNLVAHHLKVLQDAGIVSRRRSDGDRRRTYLTLTDRNAAGGDQAPIRVSRILFVCSANSARSQLAAAYARTATSIDVASAGTSPAPDVAEGARAVAVRHNLTLAEAPQAIDVIRRRDDFLIAVCDQAYEELDGRTDLHWSLSDPAVVGTDEAFEQALSDVADRISTIVSHLTPAN